MFSRDNLERMGYLIEKMNAYPKLNAAVEHDYKTNASKSGWTCNKVCNNLLVFLLILLKTNSSEFKALNEDLITIAYLAIAARQAKNPSMFYLLSFTCTAYFITEDINLLCVGLKRRFDVLKYLQPFYTKSAWPEKDQFWSSIVAELDTGVWDKQLTKATDKTFNACDNALVAIERFASADGVSKLAKELKKKEKRQADAAQKVIVAKEAKLAALEQAANADKEKEAAQKEAEALDAAAITATVSNLQPFFVVAGSTEETTLLEDRVNVIWIRDGHYITQQNVAFFASKLVTNGKYKICIVFLHVEISDRLFVDHC